MTGRFDMPWPQASLQRLLGGMTPPEGSFPLLTFNVGDRIPGDFSGIPVEYRAAVPADKVYWAYPYSPSKSKLLFRDACSFLTFRFWAKMKPELAKLEEVVREEQQVMHGRLIVSRILAEQRLDKNSAALTSLLDDITIERMGDDEGESDWGTEW